MAVADSTVKNMDTLRSSGVPLYEAHIIKSLPSGMLNLGASKLIITSVINKIIYYTHGHNYVTVLGKRYLFAQKLKIELLVSFNLEIYMAFKSNLYTTLFLSYT